MRKIYMKFSDLRNKEKSVKTAICQEKDKRFIIKEALYKEGVKQITKLDQSMTLLQEVYPNVYICPVKVENKALVFDFIQGHSISENYIECIENRNYEAFWKVVNEHMALLEGNPDNKCSFMSTSQSMEWFGDLTSFKGEAALSICNFEATSHNILYDEKKKKHAFIDYEWVFDFPVPYDLLVYHCVIKTNFLTIAGMENFITEKEMLEKLGLNYNVEGIKSAWNHFHKHISFDKNQNDYAQIKLQYQKDCNYISDYAKLRQDLYGSKHYSELLESDIERQQNYIKEFDKRIEKQQEYLEILEGEKDQQQNYIRMLEESKEQQQNYIRKLEEEKGKQQEYIDILDFTAKKQRDYTDDVEFDMREQKKNIANMVMRMAEQENLIRNLETERGNMEQKLVENVQCIEETKVMLEEKEELLFKISNHFFGKIIRYQMKDKHWK